MTSRGCGPASPADNCRRSLWFAGLVVVGDLVGKGVAQEQAVVGDTPNLAARLQGIAAPGQVVLAEPTRRLLGDVFDVRCAR
jgi:class 3 adenylate cyclase